MKRYHIKTPVGIGPKDFTKGKDGRFYISALTSADLGKKFDKDDILYQDALIVIIDPRTDEYSYIQWGNDHLSSPRTITINDAGVITVFGSTYGTFPEQKKYSAQGEQDIFITRIENGHISTRQFSSKEMPWVILARDERNYYATMSPEGGFPGLPFAGGGYDAGIMAVGRRDILPRYWQVGTDGEEFIISGFLDAGGIFHFLGYTYGTFPGEQHVGVVYESDFFYGELDLSKNDMRVIMQYGTGSEDKPGDLVLHKGSLYHSGSTKGTCGDNYGSDKRDILFAKIDPVTKKMLCRKFGDPYYHDSGFYMTILDDGTVYIAGNTQGTVGEKSFHREEDLNTMWATDAFLMKTSLKELGFE